MMNCTMPASGVAPMPHQPFVGGNPELRDATKQLFGALRKDDLASARQAYAEVVKYAPAAATRNPDSSFAALGRALDVGDMAAAKEVVKSSLQDLRAGRAPTTPVEPRPVQSTNAEPSSTVSSTGGAAGTLLNVVA